MSFKVHSFLYIARMNWFLLGEIVYIAVLIFVCIRILYDTRSATKTMSYLLLVVFLPIVGIILYFSIGVNYRNRKIYSKKLVKDVDLDQRLRKEILKSSQRIMETGNEVLRENKALAKLVLHEELSPITRNNSTKILVNGEEKFPKVIEVLESAQDHIHMEYYIYEPDRIGREIAEVLKRKAQEGVIVRFVYDDFGSRKIRRQLVGELREAGVHAVPFYKIKLIFLANRINYRNHRKIIVVDGQEAFVGGINVSDDYINYKGDNEPAYWRDMHLYMSGPVVHHLQYLFMGDWNFCAEDSLGPTKDYFPDFTDIKHPEDRYMQIVASGPDSDSPAILYSILQGVMLAKSEILITTPYFIPGESLMDLLVISAKSGVNVHIMIPAVGDSIVVNSAAQSYYLELLEAGVHIHRYKKGFVHSKTMVVDGEIVMIGTANMDIRSFDLNFEVNAIIYDEEDAARMRQIFFDDVKHASEIDLQEWKSRPRHIHLLERVARLVSPLL